MTTCKPKPIETTYNGVRLRSRLEARWAVFFDALGVKWLYEWCSCPHCGRFGIEFDGRGARVCESSGCRRGDGRKDYSSDDPRIVAAFTRARTYRFWDPTR